MIWQSYAKTRALRAKELAFLRTLPSAGNFDEVRVTQKNECNACKRACLFAEGQVTGKLYNTPTS